MSVENDEEGRQRLVVPDGERYRILWSGDDPNRSAGLPEESKNGVWKLLLNARVVRGESGPKIWLRPKS